jgi:hypothetical protein
MKKNMWLYSYRQRRKRLAQMVESPVHLIQNKIQLLGISFKLFYYCSVRFSYLLIFIIFAMPRKTKHLKNT